jgi:hypothetical protein
MATETEAEGGPDDAADVIVDADNDVAPPELTETEQIASEMGWKPQGEYTGPADKWKPAKDYILTERGVTKTLKQTVKDLKGTVDRMVHTSAKQTERALQAQAEEYERRLEQAVEDGDKEAAKEARRGLAATERQIEKVVGSPEESFAAENPWYGKDDDATAYAVSISQREAGKGATVEQQLKAAAEGVRKRFPELFDDEPRRQTLKAPPQVNAPQTRSSSQRRGTAFADLPADAKAAASEYAELFVRKGLVKTKEEALASYARDYFANEAA